MSNNRKTSKSKPQVAISAVSDFVEGRHGAKADSTEQLSEGHISQAFSFVSEEDQKFVIRISKTLSDFKKDDYAHKKFGSEILPIPKVTALGEFDDSHYFCISVFAEGSPSDMLNEQDMATSLAPQQRAFASIFTTAISDTHGWGGINLDTGNGEYDKFEDPLLEKLGSLDKEYLRNSIESVGLKRDIIDMFYEQFHLSLDAVGEPIRALTHGDLGFDNVLVNKDEVVAIIDWGGLGYSDWVFDYARCDFWSPGRYGDIKEFARNFNLDSKNIDERISLCWAYNALTTVDFAFTEESDTVKAWLSGNLPQKLKESPNVQNSVH